LKVPKTVSEAKGFFVEEIYDDGLAAGASITPTVSGIFAAVSHSTTGNYMRVEIYIDSKASWYVIADAGYGPDNNAKGIVGEANKIRVYNDTTSVYNVVVNRAY